MQSLIYKTKYLNLKAKHGYNSSGRNSSGHYNREYDTGGYDITGYNSSGRNRSGHYNREYDTGGYDITGYNSSGHNRSGHYNREYDIGGYDITGFNSSGRNRFGNYRDEYDKRPRRDDRHGYSSSSKRSSSSSSGYGNSKHSSDVIERKNDRVDNIERDHHDNHVVKVSRYTTFNETNYDGKNENEHSTPIPNFENGDNNTYDRHIFDDAMMTLFTSTTPNVELFDRSDNVKLNEYNKEIEKIEEDSKKVRSSSFIGRKSGENLYLTNKIKMRNDIRQLLAIPKPLDAIIVGHFISCEIAQIPRSVQMPIHINYRELPTLTPFIFAEHFQRTASQARHIFVELIEFYKTELVTPRLGQFYSYLSNKSSLNSKVYVLDWPNVIYDLMRPVTNTIDMVISMIKNFIKYLISNRSMAYVIIKTVKSFNYANILTIFRELIDDETFLPSLSKVDKMNCIQGHFIICDINFIKQNFTPCETQIITSSSDDFVFWLLIASIVKLVIRCTCHDIEIVNILQHKFVIVTKDRQHITNCDKIITYINSPHNCDFNVTFKHYDVEEYGFNSAINGRLVKILHSIHNEMYNNTTDIGKQVLTDCIKDFPYVPIGTDRQNYLGEDQIISRIHELITNTDVNMNDIFKIFYNDDSGRYAVKFYRQIIKIQDIIFESHRLYSAQRPLRINHPNHVTNDALWGQLFHV